MEASGLGLYGGGDTVIGRAIALTLAALLAGACVTGPQKAPPYRPPTKPLAQEVQ
jgi:hypothetical protein